MAYTEQDVHRITELVNIIRQNNQNIGRHPDYSCTYRDVPMLKELAAMTESHSEPEDWEDTGFMYSSLGRFYELLGRPSVAGDYFLKSIKCLCSVLNDPSVEERDEILDELESLISSYAKMRNQFEGVTDDCEDIIELTSPLLGEDEVRELIEKGKGQVTLTRDPVEMSEDYLAVIDDIEQLTDKELGTDYEWGKCFSIWAFKTRSLAKLGIEWRSPAVLHPKVHFD